MSLQWILAWQIIFPSFLGPLSRALGTKPSWIDKFISAVLQAANANVIAVDWVYGSTGIYFSAVQNVVKLGLEISRFLKKLLVGTQELWEEFWLLMGEKRNRKNQHMRRSFRAEAELPTGL